MTDIQQAGHRLGHWHLEDNPPFLALDTRVVRQVRRRRRRRAGAGAIIIAALAVVVAVIVTLAPGGGGTTAVHVVGQPRAGDGRVTGYIYPCAGAVIPHQAKYTGGSVDAVRGKIRSTPPVDGSDRFIFPTEVVSRQYVQPGHRFRFVLPAGDYVLILHYYADEPTGSVTSFFSVQIRAGHTIHEDMPDRCK